MDFSLSTNCFLGEFNKHKNKFTLLKIDFFPFFSPFVFLVLVASRPHASHTLKEIEIDMAAAVTGVNF
jgi:hypothetical protein